MPLGEVMKASGAEVADRVARALQGPECASVVSAYLFGSHAEDRAHRESDVDVGVVLDRRALPGPRDRFEAALRLSAHLQAALGTRCSGRRTSSRSSGGPVASSSRPSPDDVPGRAVRSLARDARFSPELVRKLERLPGFRNVVIHEYVALDLDRVVEALDDLAPVEDFLEVVRAFVADLPNS
jgi:predicted nucleotidyltransferase